MGDGKRQRSRGSTDWQQEGAWDTCFLSWSIGWEVLSFCVAPASLAFRAGRWALGPGAWGLGPGWARGSAHRAP